MHVALVVAIMKMQESTANVSTACIYAHTHRDTHNFAYRVTYLNVAWQQGIEINNDICSEQIPIIFLISRDVHYQIKSR